MKVIYVDDFDGIIGLNGDFWYAFASDYQRKYTQWYCPKSATMLGSPTESHHINHIFVLFYDKIINKLNYLLIFVLQYY